MVETVSPVVHEGRRSRYALTLVVHTVAATAAAALTGAALGAIGWALRAPWGAVTALLVAGVAALYAARELVGLPVPIPDRHRQVPEWWRTFYSPPVAAALYGAGLGIGFATFLSVGTYVAVAVAALALGDPLVGALLCAPFGVARGLSVILAGAGTTSSHEAVARLDDLAGTWVPRLANGLALAVVALAALLTL